MLAMQAPRFQGDRVVFIAGKPCSHREVAEGASLRGVTASAASAVAPPQPVPDPAVESPCPGCSRV
ncbi:hypothetical protein CRX69_01770 [Pseudomonas rhizophila]|uniref:Uncharacterized protein n=1 Tax=Pseudomonas rhizophila TaxID=2045200 RepID=A0ABM6U961_9PSED|nr:hypothetical protein CRX69_01770 [Pseudomonas rhizophila]